MHIASLRESNIVFTGSTSNQHISCQSQVEETTTLVFVFCRATLGTDPICNIAFPSNIHNLAFVLGDFFYGLYHGKSQSKQHIGSYFLPFPSIDRTCKSKQILEKFYQAPSIRYDFQYFTEAFFAVKTSE